MSRTNRLAALDRLRHRIAGEMGLADYEVCGAWLMTWLAAVQPAMMPCPDFLNAAIALVRDA